MGITNSAINALLRIQAKEIIKQGLDQALETMENMVVNEGMQSIFDSYVEPEFRKNAQAEPETGWENVDIGEYMDFMGNLVNIGNEIMTQAYDEAYIALEDALEVDF